MRKLHKLSARFLCRIGSPMTRMIPLLFVFCLLFSGCYSYKKMGDEAYQDISLNKKYKITTKEWSKKRVTIVDKTQTGIVVVTFDKQKQEVPFSDIQELRRLKFSPFKTFVVLPVSYVATGVGLAFLGYGIQ